MKLSEWAKKNNISVPTAFRRFRKGAIPHAIQSQNGTHMIFVFNNEKEVEEFKEKEKNGEFEEEKRLANINRSKEWQKANKEKINAKNRQKMESDPEYAEKRREYCKKAYYKAKENGISYNTKLSDLTPEEKEAQRAKNKKRNDDYYLANKENICKQNKERRKNDLEYKEKNRIADKKRREKKKALGIPQTKRQYTEEQKKARLETNRKWVLNNPDKIKKYAATSRKKICSKIYNNLRQRIVYPIKSILAERRVGGARKLFGCSSQELKEYIESQFSESMNWDNWGEIWEIDHILPMKLSKYIPSVAIKLTHYTNLRPLLKTENSNKRAKLDLSLWPPNFPYLPEEFGLDRKDIPYFQALELRISLSPTCYV